MWKTTALQGKNPFYASCTFCRTPISIGNIKPSHCRQRRFVRGPILPAITTRIDVRRTSILDMASDPFVTNKDCASSNPRKKAHRIYDKMLVVIDESLVKRFSIDDYNAWFIQEPIEAGILLWTVVMWHFGVDSIDNYGGKEFHGTLHHSLQLYTLSNICANYHKLLQENILILTQLYRDVRISFLDLNNHKDYCVCILPAFSEDQKLYSFLTITLLSCTCFVVVIVQICNSFYFW